MNRPAAVEISYDCMRFLITHNPTNSTLNKFTEVWGIFLMCFQVFCVISLLEKGKQNDPLLHVSPSLPPQELKKGGVNTLVRVCEATYDKAPVEKEGIQVLVSAVPKLLQCNLFSTTKKSHPTDQRDCIYPC